MHGLQYDVSIHAHKKLCRSHQGNHCLHSLSIFLMKLQLFVAHVHRLLGVQPPPCNGRSAASSFILPHHPLSVLISILQSPRMKCLCLCGLHSELTPHLSNFTSHPCERGGSHPGILLLWTAQERAGCFGSCFSTCYVLVSLPNGVLNL